MEFCMVWAYFIVIMSLAECLPPRNVTHNPRVFRFPQNTSTAVRPLPPGRVLVLSPIFFPDYLVPRMVRPSVPLILRPNIQVVKQKIPQAVKLEAPLNVKSESILVVKSDTEEKLSEVARDPGRARQLLPVQPDQLVSATSSSSSRTPSGGWAREKNTTSRIGVGEEQFVFPDDDVKDIPLPSHTQNRVKPKPVVFKATPCPDGELFCENVDDYPRYAIENVFENELDQFKELEGIDELKSPSITQRIDGNTTNEQPLCPSFEDVILPQKARNKDGNYFFIVNNENFKQGIVIEKCQRTSGDPEQKCFFNDSFPNGYKAICKQKFVYRKLVAVNDNGQPYTDTFPMPSCCSCVVIADGVSLRQRILNKFLSPTTTTTKPKP